MSSLGVNSHHLPQEIYGLILNQLPEDEKRKMATVSKGFQKAVDQVDEQKIKEANKKFTPVGLIERTIERIMAFLRKCGRFLTYFEGFSLADYGSGIFGSNKTKEWTPNLDCAKLCPNVNHLVLKGNVPNKELMDVLDLEMQSLETLNLSTNNLSKSFHVVLEKLNKFKKLKSLDLASTSITDVNIEKLYSDESLKKLEYLNLSHLPISSSSIQGLFNSEQFKASKLKRLDLDQMMFDKEVVAKAARKAGSKKINIVEVDASTRKNMNSILAPENEMNVFFSEKRRRR